MVRGAKRMSDNKMDTEADKAKLAANPIVWFAMSATFGRELKAKAYLEEKEVECFVPMQYRLVRDRNGRKERRLVPAVSNLLFAHTTKDRIQELKKDHPYLQYHTFHVEGTNRPIIVPDGDMRRFISVCETHDERLLYLSPDEVRLASGTPVKIIGSNFDGVEGTFMRVEGKRKKHVVVCIQGVAAVAIATLEDCYLQPI